MNNHLTNKEIKYLNNNFKLQVAPYPIDNQEHYMNYAQRQHFESILSSWQDNIQNKLSEIKQHIKNQLTSEIAFEDKAFAESEHLSEVKLQNYYSTLLQKVTAAIQKIKNLEYGFCDNCSQAIGIRRLEAMPIATHCIACQEIKEKQNKILK